VACFERPIRLDRDTAIVGSGPDSYRHDRVGLGDSDKQSRKSEGSCARRGKRT
jgi:hypothetical protein